MARIKLENVKVNGVDISKRALTLRSIFMGRGKLDTNEIPILNGIDFEASDGDRIGVIGRNGSGKSSLFKVIAGIYPVVSGARYVEGSIAPLIEMGIGFSPELSGRQNIKLGLVYSGRISQFTPELEQRIIDFSELNDHIDLPLKNYSSGMYSRLAFAVSIFQEPDILLLDEVFSAGDIGFVEKCKKLMDTKFKNVPISIMVNHSTETILEMCNLCYWLDDGKVVMKGDPASVVKAYEEAMI